jgi:DNA-binding CsgD family transcriptional regulator
MDRAGTDGAGNKERLARIESAFSNGIVLVDDSGAIIWMDGTARQRVNGELHKLDLPLAKPANDAVDCFAAPVELTIGSERLTLGVIQQSDRHKDRSDLVAVIETVIADSASRFTRTVMDKLRALTPVKRTDGADGAGDVDLLSTREREVLGLICEGRNDAQMSDLLGLSENTVRNHIASLYRKIGVNRRTAAVIWARERGISSRRELSLERRRRRATANRPVP